MVGILRPRVCPAQARNLPPRCALKARQRAAAGWTMERHGAQGWAGEPAGESGCQRLPKNAGGRETVEPPCTILTNQCGVHTLYIRSVGHPETKN